jgi:hypothetical protein
MPSMRRRGWAGLRWQWSLQSASRSGIARPSPPPRRTDEALSAVVQQPWSTPRLCSSHLTFDVSPGRSLCLWPELTHQSPRCSQRGVWLGDCVKPMPAFRLLKALEARRIPGVDSDLAGWLDGIVYLKPNRRIAGAGGGSQRIGDRSPTVHRSPVRGRPLTVTRRPGAPNDAPLGRHDSRVQPHWQLIPCLPTRLRFRACSLRWTFALSAVVRVTFGGPVP